MAPSRGARHGAIYTKHGRFNVTRAGFKEDFGPLEDGCDCYTCQNYSRAYVHHLLRAKEVTGFTLATIHNERFHVRLVADMREAIVEGTFEAFRDSFMAGYLGGSR